MDDLQTPDPSSGGQLIQLFPQEPSCFTCAHSRQPTRDGQIVTFCTVYDEVIDSEAYAAEDCFTYERCEEGSQPETTQEIEQ